MSKPYRRTASARAPHPNAIADAARRLSVQQVGSTAQAPMPAQNGGGHGPLVSVGPPLPRPKAWDLDGHQRGALRFFGWLLAGIAVLAGALVVLLLLSRSGALDPQVYGSLPVWVAIALIGTLGMALNRLFVAGFHGFSQKDFDAESVPYHCSLIAHAPFVVVGTLGLGAWILPAGIQDAVPAQAATPLVMAVAFFFGYYSDDLLEFVHRKLLGLFGREVQPRPKVAAKLEGTDLPVLALARSEGLAAALGVEGEALDRLVQRVDALGFTYTHTLASGLGDGHVEQLAKETGVEKDRVEGLRDFADVLRGAGSVEDALKAYRDGRFTNARDAARWLAREAPGKDGKAVAGALAQILAR